MKLKSLFFLLLLTGLFIGCKSDKKSNHIMRVLEKDADFSQLVDVLKSSGLDADLSASGTFTVFAPTNTAFSKLPTGLSSAQIAEILRYHVLTSEQTAAAIKTDTVASFETLQGQRIWFDNRAATVFINGTPQFTLAIPGSHGHAAVAAADIEADNGVIHKINNILLPDQFLSIVEVAAKRYDIARAVGAVALAGLAGSDSPLRGAGPLTLFAPLNPPNAYANANAYALVDGAGINLAADIPTLQATLGLHVAPGDLSIAAIGGMQTVATTFNHPQAGNIALNVFTSGNTVILRSSLIADAPQTEIFKSAIVGGDIIAKNGRVHLINNLLLIQPPPSQ